MTLSLYAVEAYEQIIITKTLSKSNLKNIKHKLDSLHIKMFVQKHNSNYLIYSQRYANHQNANLALQSIKKYFKYAKILKYDEKSISQDKRDNNKKYFVNFAIGEYSLTGGSSSSALNYTLESGYIYNKDIFLSLAYSNNSAGDISVNNIYSSVNYRYKEVFRKNMDLYVGGLLGYSTLKKSGFSGSSSILFGLQLGAIYKLYDYLDFYTAYQGMYVDHIIEINPTKNLKVGFIHNLQIGVTYKF